MTTKVIAPTSDLGFKKMLASPNHLDVAKGFITDLLTPGQQITSIRLVNPYSIQAVARATSEGQAAAMALLATMRDATYEITLDDIVTVAVTVTVEMQARWEPHFMKRAWYYLAQTYIDQYGQYPDNKYGSLKPVWAVNILGWNHFNDNTAYRVEPSSADWPLWRMGILELPKTPTNPKIATWSRLLRTGQARPDDPQYIQEAAGIIEYVNLTPQEVTMVDLLEKARTDQQSRLTWERKQGRSEGRAEGEQIGRAEGEHISRTAIARNMLWDGLPVETIAKFTSLSAAEIEHLKH